MPVERNLPSMDLEARSSSQAAAAAPLWQTPVGDGDETILRDEDAWYAYPGSGGTSFYAEDGRYHLGEDWNREGGENPNDQARAFGAGTVVFDGVMSGYGNTVILDHGLASDGQTHLFSLYAHLATADNFGTDLSVQAGQALGTIGSTGGDFSPHLHFELFDAETWVIGVNLSGGSVTDAEMANAQSITFDAAGNITSVVILNEVDASRSGPEYMRAFTSDYFITTVSGRDRWYDGDGANQFAAGSGRGVEAFGLNGNDFLQGTGADDLLAGGQGADTLKGAMGADEIYGDAGNDLLNGTAGRDDDLQGGAGADTLFSAGQGDMLVGGSSPLPDQADPWGDGAADVFRFSANATGKATIYDFEDGTDLVRLGALAQGMKDLTISSTAEGARVSVGGLTIHMTGVSASDLTASDFLF